MLLSIIATGVVIGTIAQIMMFHNLMGFLNALELSPIEDEDDE